jgi:hypothetical protein
MRHFASIASVFLVFCLIWAGMVEFGVSSTVNLVCAATISVATGAFGYYLWRPGGILDGNSFSEVAPTLLVCFSLVVLFIGVDAFISSVNVFDPSQWFYLWNSKNAMEFLLTFLICVVVLFLTFATLIRLFILQLHERFRQQHR